LRTQPIVGTAGRRFSVDIPGASTGVSEAAEQADLWGGLTVASVAPWPSASLSPSARRSIAAVVSVFVAVAAVAGPEVASSLSLSLLVEAESDRPLWLRRDCWCRGCCARAPCAPLPLSCPRRDPAAPSVATAATTEV